jgi:uncharacterized protein (TIGR00730 family)
MRKHKKISDKRRKYLRKKFGYLHRPTFRVSDKDFLVGTENFITGLFRAVRMFYEYMRGFYMFRGTYNCVTVFGSARFPEDHEYYILARKVGNLLAKTKFAVMTGGGPGIMEAANRGARENHGWSLACTIDLPEVTTEPPNPYVNKKIKMHYFFVRKVMMTKYSVAFIVMPGGFGTLDELFEMLTLIQTRKMKEFPLVLMGKKFWRPLLDFMRTTLLVESTISSEDIDELLITDSPEEAVDYIYRSLVRVYGGEVHPSKEI